MMDFSYRDKIETDIDGTLIQPFIVLSTRSGKTLGVIQNVQSLKTNHPMGDTAEISFDVYKYVNGVKNSCWDSIKNFKFVLLPTVKDTKYKWYEITVNIDETNDTIKHVTGIHANEAELGQLMLYEVEINTEADIDRDEYETITIDGKEYGTVFFCPEHPKNSLLHRILSDKASHYQIIHVDDTLKNIQREFSFNGVSIVDAMRQTIAPEIQCLFVFGESLSIGETNEYQRTISVYDLLDYCEDCGERGTYSNGRCTHCGSTNIRSGYGEDSGIFITTENLTDSISFTSATDQVKNFFRMSAGDDDMTAAIRNCNPNGSQYLTYFSDEMKEDMSDELVAKINEYNAIYDSYLKTQSITLPPSHINDYNSLVDKYQDYSKDELIYLTSNVRGFNMLTNYDYNSVNFKDFLQTTMMPASTEVEDTTAQEQIGNLTVQNMSPIGVEDASRMSLTSSDTAVKDYAKVYVDTALYKIDVSDSSYSNNIWTGTITVTSYVDEEDTANVTLSITFNNDGATFIRQKIEKAMAQYKVQDIGDVSFLNKDISEVREGLKRYSLDALSLLDDICSAVMDISAQAGYGDESSRLYSEFYAPYVAKKQAIMDEETLREAEINKINIVIQDIATVRKNIIDYLNMESFFGDLYPELMLYRRETEYSNPNFISEGFTDSEIIAHAQEFFKRAQEELIKASTVQHSISGDLYNLFLIPEFRRIVNDNSLVDINDIDNSMVKAFLRKFESGNWLRIRVDDEVYKLRMTNWEIDYDSPEKLQIEFSDVVHGNGTMSDISSLLSQARSMASSYDTVMRQASKGNDANASIKKTQKQGLILSQNKIIDNINEQNFVINQNGALMRSKNDFDDGYGDEQVKILNKGIYYTNDSWETVKAGLGHFMYYDPVNKEVKEDYGIIASTIVGQLLVGEDLKIYSDSGTLEVDEKGFAITAQHGADNSDIFVIQKKNEDESITKYIYVDRNGEVHISGNSVVIGGTPLTEYIESEIEGVETMADDARKVADNYLSFDNTGAMVANMSNGTYLKPSQIQSGKNVLITNQDVKIRNGQQQLASYGDTITIGKTTTGERNVYIDSNGVNIREGADKISQFGSSIIIGKQGVGQKNISINSNGIELNDNTNSIASFGNDIRIGEENNNNILLTNDSFSGTKYLKVNDEYKNIEVFNMTTGGGVIVEESPVILKESGNTVTSFYTCVGTPDDPSTIYMYLEIALVSGQNKYTPIWSREYDTNDQRSLTSGASIAWAIYRGGYSYIQRLQTTFTYTVSSKEITFTVKDTGNDADNQIESVKLVVRYLDTETSYPHYRFGVYDGYNSVDDAPYIVGNFAFDIGENNIPSGNYSFAHGIENGVQGFGSSASGGYCNVSGDYSSANGNGCSVSGACSSTVGLNNTVRGDYSFVSGVGNIARYEGQTVVGKYAPATASDDVLMVGTGTAIDDKAYAMRLKNDGRVEFKGAVGTGLAWNSRSEMVTKVGVLSLNVPYNFFATSTEGTNGTIFWSITAGAEDGANAFGTICKMTTNTWQMYFMCSGKFYISIFDVNSNTFNTTKLT